MLDDCSLQATVFNRHATLQAWSCSWLLMAAWRGTQHSKYNRLNVPPRRMRSPASETGWDLNLARERCHPHHPTTPLPPPQPGFHWTLPWPAAMVSLDQLLLADNTIKKDDIIIDTTLHTTLTLHWSES